MGSKPKVCAEVRLEDHLYELFTLGSALVIAIGYLVLALRWALFGDPSIEAESPVEFVLGVTALYLSLPFHEALHAIGLRLLGMKPLFTVDKLKEYLPVVKAESRERAMIGFSDLVKILASPLLLSLLLLPFALVRGYHDYPVAILVLGNAAFTAWDLYLLAILRMFQGAGFVYRGVSVQIVGDCSTIASMLERRFKRERYVKLWAGWTWFFFFVVGVMFVLVELGAISFREGFTLRAGPILLFSVEPVEGGFRTAFNPLGTYIVSALLALPFSYLSRRVIEWLE